MACASGLRGGGGLLLQLPHPGSPAVRSRITFAGGSSGRPGLFSSPRPSAFIGGDLLRLELDDNPEGIISGEWPENFSLLSYDDLRAYLEAHAEDPEDDDGQHNNNKMGARGATLLGEVMSTELVSATVEQTLEEIEGCFDLVSALPVIDGERRCVGVVSRRDRERAHHGLQSRVGEVMSSPAITLTYDRTVKDAAALMLKKKIHRIPILNEAEQVIGMVTRTDIFQALEAILEVA